MAQSPERKGAGTYQMLWDCKFCGTEKLLGVTHRHCPNCGAAQDTEHRYFPAEEDMVALEDHKYVGTDKICPACGQPNSAASTYCIDCGAELAAGETAATFGVRDIGTGIAESSTRRDVVKDAFDAEMARVAGKTADQPDFLGLHKQQLIIGGVLVAAVVIIGAIIFAITYRSDKTGTVTALTWERTIAIEAFRQISDSAWDENVPNDAYSVSCHEERRGSERVQVGSHEECKDVDQGDGSFRRECSTVRDYEDRPVYDDKCSYTVDRWVKVRDVQADSQSAASAIPAWPVTNLASGSGVKSFGKEREGDKHETYRVVMDLDGETKYCEFDQPVWESFEVGMKVEVKVGLRGGPDCDTLKVVGSNISLPGRN